MSDPDALRALARLAASDAATTVRAVRAAGFAVTTKSTTTDLVTDADREAERAVVDRILAARPDDGLLGEEGTERQGTTGVRWVIDPLDGTTNFVFGYPAVGSCVAAEIDGRVVAGAVADVTTEQVYSASAGGGAWLDEDPLTLDRDLRDDLATALVATGFSYEPDRRRTQARVVARIIDQVRDIRRSGSACLDLCAVAAGRVDAYYEGPLSRWDIAAGSLVAREAGAIVSGLDADAPEDGFVICATPLLHGPLRRLLRDAIGAVSRAP